MSKYIDKYLDKIYWAIMEGRITYISVMSNMGSYCSLKGDGYGWDLMSYGEPCIFNMKYSTEDFANYFCFVLQQNVSTGKFTFDFDIEVKS